MSGEISPALKQKEGLISGLYYKLVYAVLFLLPGLAITHLFDNDTYTLINIGKYIVNNGFPSTDPFTFHENLHYTVEQWLTSVIFYFIHDHFGKTGLNILAIIIFYAIALVIFLICMKISDENKSLSIIVTLFTSIFLSLFIFLRPQIFSLLIFALEIFILESYIKNGRSKSILLLPVLSLLLVNFQSAIWVFFFLLYIPYIIDSFNFKFKLIKGQGYSQKTLLLTFFISVICGFLNPYFADSLTLLIKSYGTGNLNVVTEMNSPDFKSILGIFIFVIYCVVVMSYLFYKKGDTRLRYVLITLGTAYLGLASARNISLFIICSYPFLAHYFKTLNAPSMSKKNESGSFKILKASTILLLLVLLISLKIAGYSKPQQEVIPVEAVSFIKENLPTDKMRLFNDFYEGAYLEFKGIKTFIDPRAEVFFKTNNRKEDIFKDYIELLNGEFYYKDFCKKYQLTHFLVKNGGLVEQFLKHDNDFVRLYADKQYSVYSRN